MAARPSGRLRSHWCAVGLVSGVITAVAVTSWARGNVRRFVVADRSMEPTLTAGQGLVGIRSRRADVGRIHCVEHPMRPGFWLVKRVATVDGDTMSVRSDNLAVDTVDSRRFGAVAVDGSFRVVIRIPSRWM